MKEENEKKKGMKNLNNTVTCIDCGCTYVHSRPGERIVHGYRHKKILSYNAYHADDNKWPTYIFFEVRKEIGKRAYQILCTDNKSMKEKEKAALEIFRVWWLTSFESLLFSASLSRTLETHPDFPSYVLSAIKEQDYVQGILTKEVSESLAAWANKRHANTKGIRWSSLGRLLARKK
ncbi:hypothetical protein HMPREF0083_01198 [Aneurinibacillus aneurinilyticus ATCC 12856]|uniref:Uncharacterized protein n=2 Tax=Aneurinibacillus aneurinilyticus TaxID=1391 RepID=U1X840_ANEAE|nr:hypothetical protein HMPREF0083_01198 [Aneurinibacillus aneurinilyticus ATCC 12856]